jgi:hypothetical protein
MAMTILSIGSLLAFVAIAVAMAPGTAGSAKP